MRWDDNSVTQVLHAWLEPGFIGNDDNAGEDVEPGAEDNQHVNIDGEVTDSDRDDDDEGTVGDAVPMGGTITVDGVTWKRVPSIDNGALDEHPDFDLQVRHANISDHTKEKELFDLCMPVPYDMLLQIVRDRAESVNDKYTSWDMSHVEATLKCLFGGAQFKVGTDLWSTTPKGLMPAPDFGRYFPPTSMHRLLRGGGVFFLPVFLDLFVELMVAVRHS